MASGTANENFVRINLKKKVFVRGRKTQTGSSYKRQQWKARTQGAPSAFKGGKFRPQLLPCKRCNELGHWAKDCRKELLMPLEHIQAMDEEMEEFPTLEEAMEQADESKESKSKKKVPAMETDANNQDLQLIDVQSVAVVEPFCLPGDQVPSSVMKMLKKFGHESFRPGQEAAVMRILSGQSTLV